MEEDREMHEGKGKSSPVEEEPVRREEGETEKSNAVDAEATPKSAGGWGWGFSGFSVLSDLQKAAEDISRNVMFRLQI